MRALTFAVFNAVFAAAACLTWPIYQDTSFTVLVVVSLIVANSIAFFGTLRGLRARTIALFTVIGYFVLGVPLAVPSSFTSPLGALSGLLSLVKAPVTAWKDLLTLTLPVGSYQSVLVPAFLLFFVVPVITLALALGAKKIWPVAAATALLPMVFAALFGSSATRSQLLLIEYPAVIEITLTLVSLVLVMIWLSLRRNSRALNRRHSWGVTGVAVIVGASMLSMLVVPPLLSQTPRNVLRVLVDPQLQIDEQTSPLSLYRQAFRDELFETELFQVSQAGSAQRIRIATLTGFNGQVATVSTNEAGSATARDSAFARVPSLVDSATASGATAIKIGALQGVWMPTLASLEAVSFSAPRPEALTDGFFYNRELEAGIQLADGGLQTGDSYRLQVAERPDALAQAELVTLTPSLSQPRINPEYVPESLQDWLSMQKVSRTGEGLQTLIDRLRARGYLSHSLTLDQQNPPTWMTQLPGYDFQPSRAGHSTARIDQLFTDLRDRQREVGSVSDAQLVAAIGDDEQFAVAAFMLADQLGFNARVVLGTKLVSDAQQGIPACKSGACEGSNLTAWLEVQGDSGDWVVVDVTPQYENPLAPEVDRLQDPQVVTEVQPPMADTVQPPEAAPSQSDAKSPDSPAAALDLTWLWAVVRALALSLLLLLILFGPFAMIWMLKRRRRRERQRGPEPKDSILGAWNEYVDNAIDFGHPSPTAETRTELVQRYSANQAASDDLRLAQIADRAVFSDDVSTTAESSAAWHVVDARARQRRAGANRRQRIRAAISLRSFWRWLRGPR